MIAITMPDGSKRELPANSTGLDVLSTLGTSLRKQAIAFRLNDSLYDLNATIHSDGKFAIVTDESEDGVDIIRHDAAHLLAHAVKELFPKVQVTIGPTIENGFYYDFAAPEPFSESDLEKIEHKMREISNRNHSIERKVMSRQEAVQYFKGLGEDYKVEIIENLPASEEISIYFQGDFADLCRGPHGPSTSKVKHFKLMKVAGAYWRGDSNNAMLQRIYGTAWATKADLDAYLHRIAEAEKRDHRKLGKEMDLFHFQEEAPGAVFWHHKGWTIFTTLVAYMRDRQKQEGYLEVNTPEVMDISLWEKSGHWEKFGENMFTAHACHEEKTYAVKPMNCPGHVQVYKNHLHSYRELPLRLAEFGKVHRYEASGALHGLMRVRAFTQDDAHVFCTPSQLMEECKKICDMILSIYKDVGFDEVHIKFSDRPEKRIGTDEVWDKAETALMEAATAAGLNLTLNKGEGAFYGPKLEFILRDAIGRDWQVGTLQVDLNLPVRLGAYYIDDKGNKEHPIMLHQANFGSLERFIGIMIEHFAGKLPLWISPIQVVVAPISNEQDNYARHVSEKLQKSNIRVKMDLENEKINYKIRKHSLTKIPIILVVGKKESEEKTVSVRILGEEHQKSMSLDAFVDWIVEGAKAPSLS